MTATTAPAEIATAKLAEKQKRSSATERMRRSRERRKVGLFRLTLELRRSEIDALVRCGRIDPEERDAPAAIRGAIYSVLDSFVLSTAPFPAAKPGRGVLGDRPER